MHLNLQEKCCSAGTSLYVAAIERVSRPVILYVVTRILRQLLVTLI